MYSVLKIILGKKSNVFSQKYKDQIFEGILIENKF